MNKEKIFEGAALCLCTAIALCDDEAEDRRQNAILCEYTMDSGEVVQFVVFGWPMPTTEEEYRDMCRDSGAWEQLHPEHKARRARR